MRSPTCGIKWLACGLLFLAMTAGQTGAAELAGRWLIRWDDNPKNENALSLSARNDRLTGTYINDSKNSCTVTGNINVRTQEFALTIVCPAWDIRMHGSGAGDGRSAAGSYQAYVNSRGKFTMRKM